jgi:hypothetical protein
VDVGIILGVDVFQFRMEGFVAGAGQAGIAFGDLEERITFVEVGVVVITGKPAGGLVGDLVGLGSEQLVLNETSEWLGISEVFCERRTGAYTCTQFLLVITTGEVVYLT